jgi:hypothetical protein
MLNKKMLLVVTFICAALIADAQAQPFRHFGLTSGVVRTINCDTSGVLEGSGGANMTWTISLTPVDTQQFTNNEVAPSSTPYAASYPTATNAIKGEGNNIAYTYFRVAGDSLVVLGFADSALALVYSDPELLALSSLSFGNSFTDAFGWRDSTTVSSATLITKVDATRTVTFDGTGTLVLPWKTFSHAMRFKTVSSQTDSSFFGTVLTSVVKIVATSYNWVDTTLPNNTGFSITRTTTTSSIVSTSSTVVAYSEPVTSAIAQSPRNPTAAAAGAVMVLAVDNARGVSIRTPAPLNRAEFIAYDLNGRTVTTALFNDGPSGPSTSAPLRAPLTRGIYLYSLRSGNDLVAKGKILVR